MNKLDSSLAPLAGEQHICWNSINGIIVGVVVDQRRFKRVMMNSQGEGPCDFCRERLPS